MLEQGCLPRCDGAACRRPSSPFPLHPTPLLAPLLPLSRARMKPRGDHPNLPPLLPGLHLPLPTPLPALLSFPLLSPSPFPPCVSWLASRGAWREDGSTPSRVERQRGARCASRLPTSRCTSRRMRIRRLAAGDEGTLLQLSRRCGRVPMVCGFARGAIGGYGGQHACWREADLKRRIGLPSWGALEWGSAPFGLSLRCAARGL